MWRSSFIVIHNWHGIIAIARKIHRRIRWDNFLQMHNFNVGLFLSFPSCWTSLNSYADSNKTIGIRIWCYAVNKMNNVHLKTKLIYNLSLFHGKQGKSEGFDSCDRPSNLKLDSNRQFFRPCDREMWWMTSKNNRTPLLCYCKLCASFRSHWWIKTGVTVRKRPIWVKFDDF